MHYLHAHREFEDRKQPTRLSSWCLICLVLLASAWGLSELIVSGTLQLTAIALLLLAVARALLNRPGSSTAMAAIAVLFKSVNTAPFACHLAGIALMGIAFDLMATWLWRTDRKIWLRAALTGVSSTYLSCLLFAASMVWIFQYKTWAGGGFTAISEHTFYSGSRRALVALVVVPLGLWLGRLLTRQAVGHPRTAFCVATATCLALWVLGPFTG